MSLSKKIHTNDPEDMQESDEDVSGEDESDEGEQVSAGNEVRLFGIGGFVSSHFETLCFCFFFRRSK